MYSEIIDETYVISKYGSGFIVEDISGNRGKFGVGYHAKSGGWESQPIRLQNAEHFASEEEALAFIKTLK